MHTTFEKVLEFIRAYYNRPDGFISLHEPLFVGNEKRYILDAIDSTYVSSVGKYVEQFENMIRDYTGARFAVATVNGTAALHMSLLLAGVKRGDLVITQPLSFIATCNAISYIGAQPLFVDVDKASLGLSAEKLKKFLEKNCTFIGNECIHRPTGRRITACVPMHTFGHPVNIQEISEICREYNLTLIEDSAESIGTRYHGKHTGTFGRMGIFSFNGNKTITCGGGGMIITNDEKLGKLAKHLTTQAKVAHPWEFSHDHIGYNYRLPNLNAAMACAQMELLDKFIDVKRDLAKRYKNLFGSLEIEFVDEPIGAFSNFWLNSIMLKNSKERDEFLEYSNARQVMTRPAWKLMNTLDMFNGCITGDLSNAIDIESRLVNIPSSAIL